MRSSDASLDRTPGKCYAVLTDGDAVFAFDTILLTGAESGLKAAITLSALIILPKPILSIAMVSPIRCSESVHEFFRFQI